MSVHNGNTEKIAKEIANILDAEMLHPDEVNITDIKKYDLIGFGSGIYGGRHHDFLFDFINKLPQTNKKAFVFSTAGFKFKFYNKFLKDALKSKGFDVIDDFICKGLDAFGFLKLIGGVNKKHPNENDLEKARKFAEKLKNEF